MNAAVTITQKQLSDFLLNVAVVRPAFIWEPPSGCKRTLLLPTSRSLPFSPRGKVFRIR